MKKETITISRGSVMGIVEGISVTISLHNGGVPTFEQLWASDGDTPKLDIYYREAINDLERRIEPYIETTSQKFDLQAVASDNTLTFCLNDTWPERLRGLLANKVQDYLVHAVTAGWLSDFENLSVKSDYRQMGVQDIGDILYILGQKSFGFDEQERKGDYVSKGTQKSLGSVSNRTQELEKLGEKETYVPSASERPEEKGKLEEKEDYNMVVSDRHTDDSRVRIWRDRFDLSGTSLCDKMIR